MTATTAPGASAGVVLAAPPMRKPKVGFGDLVALTLRQQRMALILTTLAYLLFGLIVVLSKGHVTLPHWRFDPKNFTPLFAGLIAVFWGAPLLATEYEQRTHLLVWSQDVSAMRWLTAKLALLGGTVVVLSGLLSIVVGTQAAAEYTGNPGPFDPLGGFGQIGYETWLPLSLAYALFGFFLGVALGALCRRIVPAMAFTLVGFTAVRALVDVELRPWLFTNLMTPLRETTSMASWLVPHPYVPADPVFASNNYIVSIQLWLDKSGHVVAMPEACYGQFADDKGFARCLINHGIVADATDYQPYSRLHIFQSVELGVYVVLIAACVVFAVWSVRRFRSH